MISCFARRDQAYLRVDGLHPLLSFLILIGAPVLKDSFFPTGEPFRDALFGSFLGVSNSTNTFPVEKDPSHIFSLLFSLNVSQRYFRESPKKND